MMRREDPIENAWRFFLTTMICVASVLGIVLCYSAFFELLHTRWINCLGYTTLAGGMVWSVMWLIHNRNELIGTTT